MRFFELLSPPYSSPRNWTGTYQAEPRWSLPGVECPTCGVTWGGIALAYPSVDLTSHPARHEFEAPRLEPYERYAQLVDVVRPLLSPGAQVEPGTTFGPLVGTARGKFGPLVLRDPWRLLVREDTLDSLQTAGLRGLVPVRAELKSRGSTTAPLFELELPPTGRLHPDCLPPGRAPPCRTCGREEGSLPSSYWLDEASLPSDRDVFRLSDAVTLILATERFVDVVRALGPVDVEFKELGTTDPRH